MTVVSLTIPGTLADGQPAVADDSSLAFREMEGLFQSNTHDENFSKAASLRGQVFRRNGLTEVFSRKTTGENWSLLAGRDEKTWDVPGGALRFRLRHPAEVLVFFTASIFRFNIRQKTSARGATATVAMPGITEDVVLSVPGLLSSTDSNTGAKWSWRFNALWEGSDSEPGSHYIQAQTILKGTSYVDGHRNDVSRGIFLPWKIRPVEGEVPVPLEDTRMIGAAGGSLGSNSGRLQAGWHNIRHTAQWMKSSYGDGFSHTMVIGNTELVVVANYGRRADDFLVTQAAKGGSYSGPLLGD